MAAKVSWEGVFPAVTTQFKHDKALSVDIDATARVIEGLLRDGVSGLWPVCGDPTPATIRPIAPSSRYRRRR